MFASPEMIFEGVKRLQSGGVIALPTETVYGLAAVASSDDAVRALVGLRGRDERKPMSVAVCDEAMAGTLIDEWPTINGVSAFALVQKHWPGPLTLVVPMKPGLRFPKWVAAGQRTIGLRCPAHPLTLALIQTLSEPVVLPSANRPGEAPATCAADVSSVFGESLFVIDGGPCDRGEASTVVRFADEKIEILREGALSAAALGLG